MNKFIFVGNGVLNTKYIKGVFLNHRIGDDEKNIYGVIVVSDAYEEGHGSVFYTEDYEEAVAEQGRIFELLNN